MKNILVIGVGLSSTTLIKYLLDNAGSHNWHVRLADKDKTLAEKKAAHHPNSSVVEFDIYNDEQRTQEIERADVVISMLPARMHYRVAEICLQKNKHMITASYVSDAIKAMDVEVKKKGLLFLNEIGVDPGIDHMSAMRVIDNIREKGGDLRIFESNCGGLVAPDYDNNPWNYKFTWNPRNVVVAGQSGAQLLDRGQYKYIPYHRLFRRTEVIEVLDYGEFESIPNRDSLKYLETYGIENIDTMYRGTLRRTGFACGWNVFVELGATDDTFVVQDSENLTYREFMNSFLAYGKDRTVEEKLAEYLNIGIGSETMRKLKWLGIFEKRKIGLKNATPAQILQQLLEEKWALEPSDKDMIVMQHQFVYKLNGVKKKIVSSMVYEGEDTVNTAMSVTVGLPVAIATKMLLTGQINETGVLVPIKKGIYEPVLNELENYGIKFIEEECELVD